MSFGEYFLNEIFGGGYLDWQMLDKCNYNVDDIIEDLKMNYGLNFEFSDIVYTIITIYQKNIQEKIDNRISEIEIDLKDLEDYSDTYNGDIDREYTNKIIDLRTELEKLKELDTYNDIESFINYIDTHIYIYDDETRKVYKEYLSDIIEKENEEIGFVYLDLE